MDVEQKIAFLKQNMECSIVFVGLMGAGKSSLGRKLAKYLGVEFVDSDHVIEGQERREIAEIFTKSGEAYFRELERATIINLADENPLIVMGTGGGAFMNEETRAVIKQKTLSVFLNSELEVLVKRVGSGVGRPLFAGKEPADVLAALMEQRYSIYREADITVTTKDEPLKETLNRVIEALYSHYINR